MVTDLTAARRCSLRNANPATLLPGGAAYDQPTNQAEKRPVPVRHMDTQIPDGREELSLYAAWFKANHQGYAKMPSDFDSAKWNMEHTDLMNELVAELEERGCEIFIEKQNSFKVESARSGVVVGGTPDVVTVHPDGRAVIYDAKTGQESASHIVQVQLYMYLLPKAQIERWSERWSEKTFEGVVVYADGSERRISADSVDDAFVSRLAEFMRKMTSDMPPRRVPSLAECGWCELTPADCPDRMESGLN